MPSLKDILGGVVKDAGKAIDNAVSGNQRQNNQQQNKGSVTFADILNQYRQQAKPQQQSRPQQQWQPVQQAQQYNAPQISEQQKKNEPAQKKQESKKEEDKENRKRFNDATANALKGMLFGGAANAANLLLSPDEANAEEAKQSGTELNPGVETENSQNSEAKGIGARIREAEKNPEAAQARSQRENENPSEAIKNILNNSIPNSSDMMVAGVTPEAAFGGYEMLPRITPKMPDVKPEDLGTPYSYAAEAPFSTEMMPAISEEELSNLINGKMSSEDVEKIRRTVYPYGPDTKMARGKEPNDTWFTDAYGHLTSFPYDNSWDSMTNGTGYIQTTDGKWADEELNLYDENPNPEGKTKEERQQDAIEDEMRAMSNAQAYLLENPGASMGGHKIGDQTINELMSEVGNNGEGYLKNEERPELGSYTADDLESMSDIVLYDLALRDPDFQKYMTDTYGAGYGNVNAFFDQYLNADNGEDKEAITRDIFLGNDAFELDPVLQAQLMQRVYNGNADLANMDPDKQGDEIVKAIMEQYGFDNPLDVALWGSDEGYQNENPLTYDREAALVGAMFSNMMDGYGGKLGDIGLSPEDVALYAAIGNSDIRGNAFDDRYNGLLSQYDRDEFLDLLGLSGYKDEFKKINFNNDNTDGKGEYTYRDWKDPGRNWSMASLYDAAAQAQTPEELQQALGVLQSDASYNPVFIDAADRLFDRGWQHGYKYGARTPQAEG